MAQLFDAGLVNAYQQILDRSARSRGALMAQAGQGASKIGTALVGRKKDADALAADLEAMRKTLAGEQGAIAEREFALNPTGPGAVQPTYGPYEAAQREAELADLGTRKADVSRTLGELDAIGPVGFRNVYDVRAPKLPERKATDYSGRWADIKGAQSLEQAQIAAEGAAGTIKTRQEQKAAEDLAKSVTEYNELAGALGKKGPAPTDPTALAQAIGAMKQQLAKINKVKPAGSDDGSKLSAGDTTPIATNITGIGSLMDLVDYGDANKDQFGRASGTIAKLTGKAAGGGFAETMASNAEDSATVMARIRTQGNPQEADIASAKRIAGDISLQHSQWRKNNMAVIERAIRQTENQIKYAKDGPQRRVMEADLAAIKDRYEQLKSGDAAPQGEVRATDPKKY